jgi:tetratricopeptide (TPR) repeat protein
MHVIRALVAAAIILSATPVAAQDPVIPSTKSQESNVPQVRVAGAGYYGSYGYGRFIYGYPFRPRVWWVVDEFVQEGRPLGFSPSAYGPNNYAPPQPSWSGWPYHTGGRDIAPPVPSTPKAESDSALAEGRGLWKSGDYAGALASFKRAVASNLSNGSARLHMGLALLAMGDLANADKAVASALDHLREPDDVAAVHLEESFRNPKERAKFEAKLVPARDGAGTLSVALAQHLLGLKVKAAKLLADSKDPSAPKLAALLR